MPIYLKNKSYSGVKGKAEVRVLSDSVRVIFADGDNTVVKSRHVNASLGIM